MEHIHDEHTHEYTHSNGDAHVHTHIHSHDDDQKHSESSTVPKETKALISYMVHHNEHHAEELAALIDSLPKNAQKKMLSAIGAFEAANIELQEVLVCLE